MGSIVVGNDLREFDNALFEKEEKCKKTRLKNLDHNIEKYNLYGFTSGVQGCHQHGSSKRGIRFPAFCNGSPWRLRESTLRRFIRSSTTNLGDVLQNLEPNSRESCRKYWLSVKDYLPSIPDWVHKAPDDYRVYTDVGNENLSTPTLLYSFYGDVSGESVQVFTEVPPGVSKFGRAYIPSYVYNSPYMIPPVRRGQNVRPLPRPQIMGHAIDMSTSVDDSSLFAEFDRWFTGDSRVRQRVQHPRSFFQIILSTTSMGWLGDGHIHEYLHLISEKQRQYPNALLQRVTHTDTFFWVFLNQLWNNVDCAVDSLVFDDCLNSYLCGRQHTMSKSMTDVDILLIPVNLDGAHWLLERVDIRKNKVWIYDSLLTFCDDKRYKLKFKPLEVIFPRWLEYVGFYNIRLE
ncbi:hypothetical protein CUMW_266870 [Citrus unshiu]|uniref:Ubiquitin-like protease family profile domain-containing protein n=1 Tax=Citrus unshiu TaxID=55188 RepID=A0A2H5QWV5_CITUN|nr:hypothetical protein CUMW_266870 [Citrus unshiu]